MDTCSHTFAPVSPVELEPQVKVSLSQLLEHVRGVDQREAFLRDVVYNSPAPSIASGVSSRRSSVATRRSKRAGVILVNTKINTGSDSDSDQETALTCSSIGVVSRRSIRRPTLHLSLGDDLSSLTMSLESGWWDDETDNGGNNNEGQEIAAVQQNQVALILPNRSRDIKVFDPSFSFSRRCLESPTEPVGPRDRWFAGLTLDFHSDNDPYDDTSHSPTTVTRRMSQAAMLAFATILYPYLEASGASEPRLMLTVLTNCSTSPSSHALRFFNIKNLLHMHGKLAAKGWAHLPPEMLGAIAQDLFDYEFDLKHVLVEEFHTQGIRRARILGAYRAFDTLSLVCTRWREAIAVSKLWARLTAHLYGHDRRMWDMLMNTWFSSTVDVAHLVVRSHFLQARNAVCGACVAHSARINFALNGCTAYTWLGGTVPVCKFHEQHGFCGMCFKDDNILKMEPPDYQTTLMPVDDFDTWFGNLQFTCERCRTQATKQAMRQQRISANAMRTTDMDELFNSYQAFGEGSLIGLCTQVHERKWLLTNTKIKDFSLQAVAGDRLLRGVPMAEALSDPEESFILYTEPSIRELAMRDFMRCWILEGGWFAPYDIIELSMQPSRPPYWQGNQPIPVPVVHPTQQEQKYTHWYYQIPSAEFKEILQSLWHQTMVDILETAFKNIIAEVLDGCLVDSRVWEFERGVTAPGNISDPGQTLQSWSLHEVWQRLLKSEYWVTGYDWRSRKLAEHRDRRVSDASLRSKSSSASSDSTVLSESPTGTGSTYQTTPSPPPGTMLKSDEAIAVSQNSYKSPTSPMASIPELPDVELTGAEARLVQSIPFVPVSFDLLPPHSLRWVKLLWQKSIHPFVACQCGICKRACQLQEEERLRGATRKAPTGGIVINEPGDRRDEDDEFEDEDDLVDTLDSIEEDFSELNAMEVSPDIDTELATVAEELRAGNENTPVQLVQQPATPPRHSTPSTGKIPLLSRIGVKTSDPVGSLSPPGWRKRSSQEVESVPSSPASAKRRRLDSSDSKLDTPSPSPLSPSAREHPARSENSSSSDADGFPPSSQYFRETSVNPPGVSPPRLHPAGFEEVTGIAAPDNSVGLNLLDFALDEDVVDDNDEEETFAEIGDDDDLLVDQYEPDQDDITQTQTNQSQNGQMQWENQ